MWSSARFSGLTFVSYCLVLLSVLLDGGERVASVVQIHRAVQSRGARGKREVNATLPLGTVDLASSAVHLFGAKSLHTHRSLWCHGVRWCRRWWSHRSWLTFLSSIRRLRSGRSLLSVGSRTTVR